jgi:signal transduction histidine kinase/CheY-like chemotaxis protein
MAVLAPGEDPAALRARVEGLERELLQERDRATRLTRERDRLEARLREAEGLRESVLGTLSHELRTPLTAILGWAQLLRGGRAAPGALQRACESIERNAKAQARLIDDLLDASRLASGRLVLQRAPLLLAGPVERAVEALRASADARRVQVAWTPEAFPRAVAADAARLEQVVRHLVDNAVKFSPAGGRVEVRARTDGAWAELSVQDEGPGIPEAFRPFLFERFRQAERGPTRSHGGLGLGLSLVRELVALHGGTVEAEPLPRGTPGARLVVRLPLAGQAALPAAAPAEGAAPQGSDLAPLLEGVSVLLVEDDPESLEVIAGLLATSGARVLQAGSAREALALLELTVPDVLLTDLRMPGGNGFDLLRAVRARPPVPGRTPLPAVALTAASSAEDRARAVAGGFDLHVSKPVDRAELAAVVRRLVPARAAAPSPSTPPRAG